MSEKLIKPDYLFEVSWEVCNKIGGIHTVISTKAKSLVDQFQDKYITIGPDVWKETHGNPEFIEDKYLYRAWRKQANKSGLHFRIGRWNIPSRPIAVLVDFTPLFSEKDKIFSDLWLKFGLNSLSGQWDYTEPAMFGYAAGQVIESFYNFHLSEYDKIVAHFHEWMTGSGALYLRDRVPQAGTLFTTHATTLARSVAGHGMPLYRDLKSINPESKANELGVSSKHSMETTVARNSDAFTSVSEITSRECEILLGKAVDKVTPNGFDNSFIPEPSLFATKRMEARKRLRKVAEGLLNQEIPENAFLVATSGRYEFKNKGIDLFIESLGKLNLDKRLNSTVVAFILIPANQTGTRTEVLDRIEKPDFNQPVSHEYATHKLVDESFDPILHQLKKVRLHNAPSDKVKVVFVPAYLNGGDGVINLDYYDALIGLDLTAFPSYYEPWGYTPLESLAFRVPSVTTSLAGFGIWARNAFPEKGKALAVIERNDDNAEEVAKKMAEHFLDCFSGDKSNELADPSDELNAHAHLNLLEDRETAARIASNALWDSLVQNYFEVFNVILLKVSQRYELFKGKKQPLVTEKPVVPAAKPKWKKMLVEVRIPEELADLQRLAKNLWWTWNYEAEELFSAINNDLWLKCNQNPNMLLDQLSLEDYEAMLADKTLMEKYRKVILDFDEYMKVGQQKNTPPIAYLSMEYGMHTSIKIYSGGLGVLAGDFMKQASDDNINMIGIGLLYRYGYFSQNLSLTGEQLASYSSHNFSHMSAVPVRNEKGEWIRISIAFPGRTLQAKIWKIDVGRVPLFLLDTDIPENNSADRFITHQLYGGDWENRFKQEFLLGIGGIRLMDALGITPAVYHLNEGHAAFAGLERLRKLVQDQKLSFYEALEVVRSSSLFTTHTPVPAGHDHFSEDMLRTYMPHYADRLGVSWETFMSLGKMKPGNADEPYSMSVLAAKLSQEVNGVSRLHGKVSRDMFKDLYPGYYPDELHLSYVTNGVHYGTWTAKEWQQLYEETFGKDFQKSVADPNAWEKIYSVPDERIWDLRNEQRKKLMEYIRERMLRNLSRRQETPRKIYQTLEGIDDKVLTIGFARRFATYKRAHLLFNDLERLSKILNNPKMPVQLLYAGKAHPADKAGQDLIKHIVDISKRSEFKGKILFLEDYDMQLGAALTKGVDIWLNTPTRPLEASGTSGMKAVLNGVMNFSVLDGWWAEGYVPEAGWAVKEERTYDNQAFQDELDAETIYSTLENEIAPMFYKRDKKDVPVEWIRWIKNNIYRIAPHYTNKRMMDDYFERFYNKLFESSKRFHENNFENARGKWRWKSQVIRSWDSIEVEKIDMMNTADNSMMLGDKFKAEIVLDVNELDHEDLGIEVVFVRQSLADETDEVISVYEMEKKGIDKNNILVTFHCEVPSKKAGVYNYAFRVFPKGKYLAHRQDLPLVRWI
ncbi:MAG: alpha-glucan family phosphorylase [Bacteroidales bacterium]|jgi:phosphorylase/glycogen(starch) synthase|nr:alpha-glucan family phosphorylase [Bacteroidales bacterium]NLM91547.1 alpha-glucan family phosphorylase [Bacteroidales bacterium]